MGEARIAHRLVHLVRDAAPFAGDQRRRDLAGLARKRCADARVDGGAQGIDGGPGGEVPRRRARLVQPLDLARGVTRRAEPCEPGLAGEVEAARLDWLGRRLERRLQRDESAGLVDRVAFGGERHAHTVRELGALKIAERRDPHGEPRPALVAQLMILDEAGHRHIAELVGEHGRARHLGAELGVGEAERDGKRGPADGDPERSGAKRKAKSERSDAQALSPRGDRAHGEARNR